MELSQHCKIRIANLEDYRDKPRSMPLSSEAVLYINKNIAVNQLLIEMVKKNPYLRFHTKYPDKAGELY